MNLSIVAALMAEAPPADDRSAVETSDVPALVRLVGGSVPGQPDTGQAAVAGTPDVEIGA